MRKKTTIAVAAGLAGLVTVSGVGGAVAAGKIHGANIAHHTIGGINIKRHTITALNVKRRSLHRIDFTKKAIAGLHGKRGLTGTTGVAGSAGTAGGAGTAGAAGTTGPAGPPGPAGPAGADATFSSLPWGLIGRNTYGSPVAQYRVGPATPPLGIGSLGIEVAGPPPGDTNPADAQKLSFGVNGTDFATETRVSNPLDITTLKYSVFTDMDYSSGITPPGLTIESDPDISDGSGAINYTSLVYVPPTPSDGSHVGLWQTYDATAPVSGSSGWFATGRAGTQTGCTLASLCSLSALQAQLGSNASIITFAISKGHDNAFIGGVDDLKVNSTTFDFEPLGVSAH